MKKEENKDKESMYILIYKIKKKKRIKVYYERCNRVPAEVIVARIAWANKKGRSY